MKRGLLLVLVVVCAFALVACSTPSEGSTATAQTSTGEAATEQASTGEAATAEASTEATGTFTVGYDIYYLGNSWSVQMYKEFEAEAAKHTDVIENIVYTDSGGDAAKQVSNVEDLIAKKVDVLIISPIDTTSLIPTLEDAKSKGIKIVLLGATLDPSFTDYDMLVTVDDTEFGKAGGEWLANKLNGKGNVVFLDGMAGLSTNDQRIAGAKSELDKYPDIKIIGEANADWDYAKAKTQMSNMLAAYPEIDGVYSQGGAMTVGAIEAFQAANRDLVPMTGEDYNGLLKMWKENASSGFDCVCPAKPTWIASEALIQTIKLMAGEQVDKDDIIPPPTVTSDNLDQYVRTDLPDDFWCMTRMSDDEIAAMFNEQKK